MSMVQRDHSKQHISIPGMFLRLEGLSIFIGMIVLYAYFGYSWWIFALCLLVPDVAIAAYLINKQAGALAYNIVHSYVIPLILVITCLIGEVPIGLQIGLIWLAHIGMDRCVGYGLKYTTNFNDTHLARV